MKLKRTPMMTKYLVQFAARITIFLMVFTAYLTNKEALARLVVQPITMGITTMHVLWAIFMVMMLRHIIPLDNMTMALRKAEENTYTKVESCSELELLRKVQDQNRRAWLVMLVWLIFNAVFGVLYLFSLIDSIDLVMLSVFYFLCDYICILCWCPFQTFIMKNKCCVNCRIYDWGHFMMFTPMLFIRDFFSWSLFFTSCVVLLRWEIVYSKYPERFWEGSNETLKCANCKDKTCQMKKQITAAGKGVLTHEKRRHL